MLADLAFHLHHPELSGRSIKSSEKALIAEWRSYCRVILKALAGAPKTRPPAKPSTGGSKNEVVTIDDLVDAAIANLKKTEYLSEQKEDMLRALFEKTLKELGLHAGLPAQGWPPNKLVEWFNYSRLVYKVIGGVLTIWGPAAAVLVLAGFVMSAISVVLMINGFGFALYKALDTGYRGYGCYGQADYLVAWAYGGPIPKQSRTILNNANDVPYGHKPKRAYGILMACRTIGGQCHRKSGGL